MKQTIFILITLFLITSCISKLEDESIFPKVENITQLTKTDFTVTLESSFNFKKNIIYGATIPFAWNEIRNEIGGTLSDFSSNQLEEINNTKSYISVLKENEYETSIIIVDTKIIVKAYFKKSLPFEEPLTKFDKPLAFNESKVESFGFLGNSSSAKINYYNSKNEFSITLYPQNKEHEIILVMSKGKQTDFNEFFDEYNQEKGLEKNNSTYFNEDDKVEIPIIEFNLEKTFDNIIGSSFNSDKVKFEITELYQRNAFILNENGAEVESQVVFSTDAKDEIEDKPKPKMMIFNKPFVVFLKRIDAKTPYFGVYIANEELLKEI